MKPDFRYLLSKLRYDYLASIEKYKFINKMIFNENFLVKLINAGSQ
jgi:hypothetical protein